MPRSGDYKLYHGYLCDGPTTARRTHVCHSRENSLIRCGACILRDDLPHHTNKHGNESSRDERYGLITRRFIIRLSYDIEIFSDSQTINSK